MGSMRRLLLPALVLLAGCGTDVAGPSSTLLSCVFGDPAQPAVGEAIQVRGPGHSSVCLEGDPGAEFLYVPVFATVDTSRKLDLSLTGAGVADGLGSGGVSAAGIGRVPALDGPVALDRRPDRVISYALDNELRRRAIRELGPKIRPGTPSGETAFDPAGAGSTAALDVPVPGELRDFNAAISCSDTETRTGRVMYVSDHAVVYADTANPADLSSDDYAYFGITFDTLVYRVETEYFGAPTDIDDNGRAILFFTRKVNEFNPPDASSLTIGFFWSGDLFPDTSTSRLEACPASNHGEMFYLIAPDPSGVAGAPFTLEEVRHFAIPLIGHEFQHLINASRRLFINNANTFEAPWLNEGLSHSAEELLYFDVSGLGTGRNLNIDSVRAARAPADTLFNRYMGNNFSDFAKYLSRPDTASLMGPPDELTTRGAIWNFLRYASDRSPVSDTAFYHDLVNGTESGVANLNAALGGEVTRDWISDWAVSLYADDHVAGLDPRFRVDTWNLRSIYENSTLQQYPLDLHSLTNGGTVEANLQAGGTILSRFGVTNSGLAAILVQGDGGTPPASLRGTFLRIR